MRVLVTGSSGFLGQAVVAQAEARGHDVVGACRSRLRARDVEVDLTGTGAADGVLREAAPAAVVHCAALADIAPCRDDPRLAERLNAELPGELAQACAARGVRFVHVSTDQVFDGSRGPWVETDRAEPLHAYGETKLEGERRVAHHAPEAVIVRLALLTGRAPVGRRSATSTLLDALARGERPRMFVDELRSPIAVVDAARALVDLVARSEVRGLRHAGGPRVLSRHALARREAREAGLDPAAVAEGSLRAAGLSGCRPANLALDSRRLFAELGWAPRSTS